MSSGKIVRAVPKAETQEDKSGALKFRVKLLAESGGQSTMDVLCQVSHSAPMIMICMSTFSIFCSYLIRIMSILEVTSLHSNRD